MSDITLKDIKSGFNLSKINDNFVTIENAINDEIVHNTGGNNVMSQDFDMNSKRILNLPVPLSDLEPLRKGDIVSSATGATVQFVDDSIDAINILTRHESMDAAIAFYKLDPPLDGEQMVITSFHVAPFDVGPIYSILNKPVGGGSFVFHATTDKALHNGGTIIDHLNTADLSIWDTAEQTIWVTAGTGAGCWIRTPDNRDTQAGWFGVNGTKLGIIDNSIPLQQAVDFTPPSSTLRIETGVFSLSRNLYLGAKKMHIRGEGSSDSLKDAGNRDLRGTILSFGPTALLGLWYDHATSPALENNSRFSSVKNLTVWGDGTSVVGINQHNATNVGIDISNKGILLDNIIIDYVKFGINVMRCVSVEWGRNQISADVEGLRFPAQLRPEQTYYDKGVLQTVAAQSGRDTFTTASDLGQALIFGDSTNPAHFACRQFSQNGFSGNKLDLIVESGYNGVQFEATNATFGTGKGSATFGTESVVSLWIEAMNPAGFHIRELSDSAVHPLIRFDRLHRSPTDASKVIAFSDLTLVLGEDGLNPLSRVDSDIDANVVGTFGDRVGSGFFHMNGVGRNSVLARYMNQQAVPFVDFNRTSIKVIGKQEHSYLQAVVPKTAVKTATFSVGLNADFKAFILTIDFVGLSTTSLMGRIVRKSIFQYDNDSSLIETVVYDSTNRFELTTSVNASTDVVTFFISQLDGQSGTFNGGGSISVTACGSNTNNFELDLLSLV